MSERLVTIANRNLTRSTTIFGFEIFDILIIFLTLSILNFFFGQSSLKIPVVWGGSGFLAALLYFTKRNKAENYLVFKLRYWMRPGVYYATSFDLKGKAYIKNEK